MLLLIIILLANLVIVFPIGNSLIFPLESFAQIKLPKTVEPGRIPSRFKPYPVPQSKLAPLIPSRLGNDSVEELKQVKFLLSGVLIEGSTIYQESDLLPLYKEYLGTEIDLAKIHEITNRITQKYHDDGYTLSKAIVENQQVKNGIIIIKALEGYVDKIEIENDTDLPDAQ
jgi:hemolysin activation/secretion protein